MEPDPQKRLKYLDFVEIYTNLTDNERERYQRDYPEKAKAMQSYSEHIRQEGEQIGIQLGEANVLLFLLEQKFGTLSDAVLQRVKQADPETLLIWSGRVLKEDSIDEIIR